MENSARENEPTETKSRIANALRWTSYSMEKLETAETSILKCLKTPYRGFHVNVKTNEDKAYKIWTLAFNEESKETPILRIHGLGMASALWLLNFDTLAKDRPIYAIDNLGFGKSSRPEFSKDPLKVEEQYVEVIEEWRKQMNIPKFNLCGHSMGGFLSMSYALKYPERVKHLILSDPWGIPERTPGKYVKRFCAFFGKRANLLWPLRAAGPTGPWIVLAAGYAVINKFAAVVEDKKMFLQYIHQCNLRRPTGEAALRTMSDNCFWAKHPMVKRMKDLSPDIPLTMLFGEKSFVDRVDEQLVREARPNSYLKYQTLNCGHEIYAEQSEEFNDLVTEACKI